MRLARPLKIVAEFLSVVTVAVVLAEAFLFRSDPLQNLIEISLTVYSSFCMVLAIVSLISYKHNVNTKLLFIIITVLIVLRCFVFLDNEGALGFLANVMIGCIRGLSVVLVIKLIASRPKAVIRSTVFLGAAGACVILPLFHSFGFEDGMQIQLILYLTLPVLFFGALKLNNAFRKTTFQTNKQLAAYPGKRSAVVNFFWAQRKTSLIMLAIMIPFFFCQGLFANISFDKGTQMTAPDEALLITGVIFGVFFITEKLTKEKKWFEFACLALGISYMAMVFSLLIITDYPPLIYGIMRGVLLVMQIYIFILMAEIQVGQNISTDFLCIILVVVYFIPNILGFIFSSFLDGPDSYTFSIMASAAMMAIAIVACIILALFIRARQGDFLDEPSQPSINSEETTSDNTAKQKDEVFSHFSAAYRLSAKERDVIELYSQGRSVRYISSKLYLSESTARTYVQRVYTKLNIHSRQELLDIIDSYE